MDTSVEREQHIRTLWEVWNNHLPKSSQQGTSIPPKAAYHNFYLLLTSECDTAANISTFLG